MPYMNISITSGSDAKGLRLTPRIVQDYNITAERVQEICKTALKTAFFNAAVQAQFIDDNIEEVD